MDFGLYIIITKPSLSYTEIAQICVRTGIRYLQLREKELSDRELINAAIEIKKITDGTQTKLVINDRADIALIVGADLLHLGQDDLSVEQARKIVGDMPIGLSTHSIEQAKEAIAKNPEYIGFGPIFPTTTKKNPDPTVGTILLKEVLSFSKIAVVAIGGIFPENIEQVLNTGAKNICLVRHLMCDKDLEKKIIELQKQINNN